MASGVSTTEVTVGDKTITFETGKLAKQASGAVVVRTGDTMVLVTAVVATNERNVDFFPLTVDVEAGMYAAGKIPGGFIKKEGRASDHSILTARLIDRPIRPLWPKGFNKETHIVATVLSVDKKNPYDVLAVTGASAALCLSEAPFGGPVGAVRVAKVEGEWVVNPTYEEIEQSPINLVVAGTKDAIGMVEAGCEEVDEADIIAGLEVAHDAIKQICAGISAWAAEVGEPKMEFAPESARQGAHGQGQSPLRRPAGGSVQRARQARPLRRSGRPQAGSGVLAGRPKARPRSRLAEVAGVAKAFDAVEKEYVRHTIAVDKKRPDAPRRGRDPGHQLRSGPRSADARLRPLHPRPDPGPHSAHPGRRPGRAARRRTGRRRVQALHAPLQVPALQRG